MGGGAAHGTDYAYDAMGRLTDVKVDGVQRPSGAPAWSSAATYAQGACVTYAAQKYCSQTSGNQGNPPDASASWAAAPLYAYGPNGNRIAAPGLTSTPVYDDQDRLLSYGHFSYTYKADGSLRTKTSDIEPVQTTTYDYDAFGNLRNVKLPDGGHVEYVLDAQNRRVGKKRCTTAIDVPCPAASLVEGFLYRSQLQPVVWLNGDGSVKARFVYGGKPNVPEYMVTAAGASYRLITDQVGSVRLVVDVASGAVAQAIEYDEFGNMTSNSAAGTEPIQPFGFAGGLYDSLTGLTRFGARDYDATIGRWNTKDPLAFGGGQANLYVYSGGDPLNLLDPSGLSSGSVLWNYGVGVGQGLLGTVLIAGLIASGPVGVAIALGLVFYGGFQLGTSLLEVSTGENPYSGRRFTDEERGDIFARSLGQIVGGGSVDGVSREAENSRYRSMHVEGQQASLLGWRLGATERATQWGEFPHYHRALPDPLRPGNSLPDQGMGNHRPWEGGF